MSCTDETTGRLIARYELNLLTDEERQRFEEHLLNCDHCYEDFYSMAPIIDVVKREQAALRTALESDPSVNLTNDSFKSTEKIRLQSLGGRVKGLIAWDRRISWSVVGAAVAVLLLIWIVIPDPVRIGEMVEVETPAYQTLQLRSSESEPWVVLFNEGMQSYSAANYDGAVSKLLESYRENPNYLTTRFYLGLSYLFAGRPDSAVIHLQAVIDSHDPALEEESRWFLGYLYLMQEDISRAKAQFERVANMNGTYAGEASDLVEQISQKEDTFFLLKILQEVKGHVKGLL